MCGITGLYSRNGLQGFGDSLQKANDLVNYRGPDGAGFALFNSEQSAVRFEGENVPDDSQLGQVDVALGHRRLSIIDLSAAGRQPMHNQSESLWISFNGEIYNYVELREELSRCGYQFHSHSDTEVLLAAYETWGDTCVNRFNGMWSFAIVDLEHQKLFCSRDRFGIKPFYYFYDGQHLAFSSEIKQLLEFPFVTRRVNDRAVFEYLMYQALDYDEETFFEGINKLYQGYNLTLDLRSGVLEVKRYYDPSFSVNRQISLEDAGAEFRRLLIDSVRLHLRSDVEVGTCLSGGLDSSSLVCIIHDLLTQEGKGEIQRTFSSHFNEDEANELEYMQEVIRTTGVKAGFIYPTGNDLLHDLEKLVWHHDEPFGSTSIFAQWSVFKLVHQHQIKVMLDGQGADEQLAGYLGIAYVYFAELLGRSQFAKFLFETSCFARLQNKNWFSMILPYNRLPLLRRFTPQASFHLHTQWVNPSLANRFQGESHYLKNQQLKPFGEAEQINNLLYQFTFHNNLPQLLTYEDRNSMAFSVESRVPFLDYRLVEFIFSLPADMKIRDGYTKRVMREGMQGVLPEKIRRRVSKLGFATPEHKWQQTMLRPLIQDALQQESVREYILPEAANSYLNQLSQHHAVDFAPWRWLNLVLWKKAYGLA